MVLAELLPQVATFDAFYRNFSTLEFSKRPDTLCLNTNFHEVFLPDLTASSLQVDYHKVIFSIFHHFLSRRSVSSPSQLVLHFTTSPLSALSERLQCGWCFCFHEFVFIASLGTVYRMLFATFSSCWGARRATVQTTVTLSHAASRQKTVPVKRPRLAVLLSWTAASYKSSGSEKDQSKAGKDKGRDNDFGKGKDKNLKKAKEKAKVNEKRGSKKGKIKGKGKSKK